ncbi:MAG TPA: hypothetical protein VFE60_09540 [Roseiarcus sp.]|nr:hypothetical protein [Roseiarcus sp.]
MQRDADPPATDLETSQNGRSKTDAGPVLAVVNGMLYLAHKGSGSDDIWYNVVDGTNWLAQDLEISQNGRPQPDTDRACGL